MKATKLETTLFFPTEKTYILQNEHVLTNIENYIGKVINNDSMNIPSKNTYKTDMPNSMGK